jgi:hypothetical protein
VTAIETSAVVTVRPVEPVIEPDVAPMVVPPVPAAVAKPLLLILATAALEELQVTELLRF